MVVTNVSADLLLCFSITVKHETAPFRGDLI